MANNISDISAKATLDVGPMSKSLNTMETQTRNATSKVAADAAKAGASFRQMGSAMGGLGLTALGPLALVTAGIASVNRAAREALATTADPQVQAALRAQGGLDSFVGNVHTGLPIFESVRDAFTLEARQQLEQSNRAVERQARSLQPLRDTARAIDAATNALRDQAATFDMTTEQAQRYALVMRGIRAGVPRETIEGMLAEFDAAASEAAKTRAFRESLTQAQEQKRTQEAARIAQETRLAQRDLGTSPELGDLEMGSRAAQAVINAAMAPRQMERVVAVLEDVLEAQKEQAGQAEAATEHLEEIKRSLSSVDPFSTI